MKRSLLCEEGLDEPDGSSRTKWRLIYKSWERDATFFPGGGDSQRSLDAGIDIGFIDIEDWAEGFLNA